MNRHPTPLPARDAVLAFIAENPAATRREIARAFGIKAARKADFKAMLDDLSAAGALPQRKRGKRAPEATLPPVSVIEITGPDADGDLFATPIGWKGDAPPPRILMLPADGPALGKGERVLARLDPDPTEAGLYRARLMRRLARTPARLLAVFRATQTGGRLLPIERGALNEWQVPAGETAGAQDGELVEAEQTDRGHRLGLPKARVIARLGDPSAPRAISLIAIHQHGIPDHFADDVLDQAAAATEAPLAAREDLRHLPFITIDPSDARDHDDAVYAHPDTRPENPGGHVVWVAIADVAHYVTPGSPLDREARTRGNSTYFPDRVVPMLPERLSADLCSLMPGVDRPVIAVQMILNAEGEKTSQRFARALIRSRAALSYEQVQAAQDGAPDAEAAPWLAEVIAPLYAAHTAAAAARDLRAPLDLDLPERRIVLDEQGHVTSVAFRERLLAHRLIEDFMVLANVAAAQELARLRRPLIYRVHEEPSPEKLDALREVAEASGFTLARGQVLMPRHLNRLLAQAQGSDFSELINITTLRSMPQAYYHPQNLGHFGLALREYAHFTSPIRRYADLIVHRALISGHGWGSDGLSPFDIEHLQETAQKISEAERRSMTAERETTDRYLAAWLSERVGETFEGRIAGVQRFGLFVRLDASGADGLIPIREVGREFFHFDPDAQTLIGSHSGTVIGMGQRVTVRLAEAAPMTGGLRLELLALGESPLPAPKAGGRGRGKPGRPGKPARPARKLIRRGR